MLIKDVKIKFGFMAFHDFMSFVALKFYLFAISPKILFRLLLKYLNITATSIPTVSFLCFHDSLKITIFINLNATSINIMSS